ncbi:hypothetical protein [Streptomyces sp. RFCAC02]|uniref:hypothetical protein n=1 Tax=Streptomyces sp. RFCAC02 TaxID=2499143 RepID=UPI00101EF618|nr:hypothetical protein [Streptomyces sp. RFCAC02]
MSNAPLSESELELLHALKRGGVREIAVDGADVPAGPPVVDNLLDRLRRLEAVADDETREVALRMNALDADRRDTVRAVLDSSALLDALRDEHVRALTETAAALPAERTASALRVLRTPALLDALAEERIGDIARESARLSPGSRQAVLTLIGHLQDVERGPAG